NREGNAADRLFHVLQTIGERRALGAGHASIISRAAGRLLGGRAGEFVFGRDLPLLGGRIFLGVDRRPARFGGSFLRFHLGLLAPPRLVRGASLVAFALFFRLAGIDLESALLLQLLQMR